MPFSEVIFKNYGKGERARGEDLMCVLLLRHALLRLALPCRCSPLLCVAVAAVAATAAVTAALCLCLATTALRPPAAATRTDD